MILQLKAIGIANILKFPFPTTPNLNHIRDSIISLVKLKALQLQRKKNIDEDDEDENIFETIERNVKNNKDETNLTELGKVLVYIPLHPRYAKMILEARKINCLGYMLLIVCALSVDQLCINEKISSNNNLISDTKQNMINKNKGDVFFFIYNNIYFQKG